MNREIVEAQAYTQQLQSLGNLERVDEVLTAVQWAVSTRPEEFAVVYRDDIRFLRSRRFGGLPELSFWFRILDENQVEMLYVVPTYD